MTVESVFLVCFLFGSVFSSLSFLLGAAGSILPGLHLGVLHHADPTSHLGQVPGVGHHAPLGHVHPGGHGPIHGTLVDRIDGLPVLSLSALLAFVTGFGGVGYLLSHYAGLSALLSIPLAALAGAAGDLLIAAFLSALIRSERVLDPRDFRLEGVPARVSVGIAPNGVGEIIYSLNGRRWSDAARSLDGKPLPKGSNVVIIRFEKGIAYVQSWNEFVAESAPELMEDVDSTSTGHPDSPAETHGPRGYA